MMTRALLCVFAATVHSATAVRAQDSVSGSLVGCFDPDTGDWVSCDGPSEPNVHIVEAPPVIVWHHASAEGSTMPALSDNMDPRVVNQLNAMADTAITLRAKAEFAMAHGDPQGAQRYLSAAEQKDPGDPETRTDQEALNRMLGASLKGGGAGLYDQGSQNLVLPGKFQKTDVLTPTPPSAYARFANDPRVIALHNAEMAAYYKLAAADLALKKAHGGPSAAPAPPQDVAQAQAKFEQAAITFKKAQTALKKKIYVLDK